VNGYRLPTEGEWEYAARWKGTDSLNGAVEFPVSSNNWWTPYNYASGAAADYNNAAETGLVAWYDTNSENITHDAGGKNPNALYIYDMSGNVWEGCWDWYASYSGTATDYKGIANGTYRINRGGSYPYDAVNLQTGGRNDDVPFYESSKLGFRLARTQ